MIFVSNHVGYVGFRPFSVSSPEVQKNNIVYISLEKIRGKPKTIHTLHDSGVIL